MSYALLTGISRGIGRAFAEQLVARGVEIVALARPSLALEQSVKQLELRGGKVQVLAADLAERRSYDQPVAQLLRERGAPRILAHIAGVVQRAKVSELLDEQLDQQLEINFTAAVRLSRAVLPAMLTRGEGRLLFCSSISSRYPTPTQSLYNASKAALDMFVRCLAEETRDRGLLVASVLPGAVDTEMLKGSSFPPRMSAEEVARTLAFLAFEAQAGHHGACIEMFGV